jgi:hypothetical protein
MLNTSSPSKNKKQTETVRKSKEMDKGGGTIKEKQIKSAIEVIDEAPLTKKLTEMKSMEK